MDFELLCLKFFNTSNIYQIFNIPRQATHKDIQKAYYRLCLELHPDRVEPERKNEATEKFKLISNIYRLVFCNPIKKARYDRSGKFDGCYEESLLENHVRESLAELVRKVYQSLPHPDIKSFLGLFVDYGFKTAQCFKNLVFNLNSNLSFRDLFNSHFRRGNDKNGRKRKKSFEEIFDGNESMDFEIKPSKRRFAKEREEKRRHSGKRMLVKRQHSLKNETETFSRPKTKNKRKRKRAATMIEDLPISRKEEQWENTTDISTEIIDLTNDDEEDKKEDCISDDMSHCASLFFKHDDHQGDKRPKRRLQRKQDPDSCSLSLWRKPKKSKQRQEQHSRSQRFKKCT